MSKKVGENESKNETKNERANQRERANETWSKSCILRNKQILPGGGRSGDIAFKGRK